MEKHDKILIAVNDTDASRKAVTYVARLMRGRADAHVRPFLEQRVEDVQTARARNMDDERTGFERTRDGQRGRLDRAVRGRDDHELREIHRRHLADEVHHARVGWAHVASLPADVRAVVTPYLEEILRAQVIGWESRLATLPEAGVLV